MSLVSVVNWNPKSAHRWTSSQKILNSWPIPLSLSHSLIAPTLVDSRKTKMYIFSMTFRAAPSPFSELSMNFWFILFVCRLFRSFTHSFVHSVSHCSTRVSLFYTVQHNFNSSLSSTHLIIFETSHHWTLKSNKSYMLWWKTPTTHK